MNELIVTMGADQRLVGTLCMPTEVAPKSIAFVMLNAGVVSRIGPHRFNVKLSRHLATQGFSSLRFDLSGQGDSAPPSALAAASQEEQVMLDLRDALDHIAQTTGIERFVIAGICSGAVAAYFYAQRDERVIGTWMLDGYTFHTWQSHCIRYAGKVSRLLTRDWSSTLAKIKALLSSDSQQVADEVDYGSNRQPSKIEYITAMQSMAHRGMRSFMMFSSDIHWYYNYQNQFVDAFRGQDFASHVTTKYLPTTDHTLTQVKDQTYVIECIGTWACTLAD
ncbi:MAG: alpha/beta fold hydrolase [Aquabacterium sp.]|nr:alpha/beta fold hydrolase [Aquabacterium sp.]